MAVVAKARTGAVKGLTRSADIRTAVAAVQHVPPHIRPAVRRHIMRKAKGIKGAVRHIPPHWHPSGAIRHVRPAQALALAEAAGVTLDLANDLNLAGRWKHGWIPLDAVAAAVKAKRYHGGGGEGHSVRGKGRAGSAVEARREPSRGRTKGALPTRGRTFSDAADSTVSRRGHGLSTGSRKAASVTPVGSRLEHDAPQYVVPADHAAAARAAVRMKAPELRERAGKGDKIAQAELDRRVTKRPPRARRDSMGVLVRPTGLVTSTGSGLPAGYTITNDEFGPALHHNGKLLRTTSKGFEQNLVQYARDHAAGDTSAHPRTVQDQLDAAKAGKASLDGRSAASMSAAERARAAEIMHGTGSKQHRKALATVRAQEVAQDRTRSVEAARVGRDEAKVRAVQASHPVGASVEAQQPGIERVTHGKVVGHDHLGMVQVEYKDRHGKAVVGRYNPGHVKLATAPKSAKPAGAKPVRGKVKRYKLERTLPDGTVKQSEPVTLADAERAMMGVLHYNQGVSKGEAGRLAPQLRHVSVGQHVEAHGYKFRLVDVGEGSNHPKADAPPAAGGAGGGGGEHAWLAAQQTSGLRSTERPGSEVQTRSGVDQYGQSMTFTGRVHGASSGTHKRFGHGTIYSMHNGSDGSGGDATARGMVFVPDDPSKLQAAPAATAGIRIEHSGDSTLVHGTERGGKDATAALKANGFKWSSNLGSWYLPRNWSEPVRAGKVKAVQSALGDRVAVEQGSVAKSTTAAERAAARTERNAELVDQHTARAGKLSAEADRRFGAERAISDHIPMGQPILVGHHSESRHRRDLARMEGHARAGIAAHDASKGEEARAQSAESRVRRESNPQALSRRIDRNSAEVRRLDRMLNGTGKEIYGTDKPHPPGEHRDRLQATRDQLAADVEHDKQTLAGLGVQSHGKDTVSPGDYVRVRGSVMRVEKSSPKTFTVKSHGLTLKYPYSEIQAHSTQDDLLSKASDTQLQAFIVSKRGTPEAVKAQRILDERKRQAG